MSKFQESSVCLFFNNASKYLAKAKDGWGHVSMKLKNVVMP